MSLGEAALAWAKAGWPVFPCRAAHYDKGRDKWSKRPHEMLAALEAERGLGGWKLATTNVKQIKKWWDTDPDALIGVPPGLNGAVVLDADGHAGIDSLQHEADADSYDLDSTYWYLTPGGMHVWFDRRATKDRMVSNGRLQGIPGEARGDRGYVIVPPSVLPDGKGYHVTVDTLTLDKIENAGWAGWALPWEKSGTGDRADITDVTTGDQQAWLAAHSIGPYAKPDEASQAEVDEAVLVIRIAAEHHPGDPELGRYPVATGRVARLLTLAQHGLIRVDLTDALNRIRDTLVAVKPKGGPDLDRFIADAIALRVAEDRAIKLTDQIMPRLRLLTPEQEAARLVAVGDANHRVATAAGEAGGIAGDGGGDSNHQEDSTLTLDAVVLQRVTMERVMFRVADAQARELVAEMEADADADMSIHGMQGDAYMQTVFPDMAWTVEDLWATGMRVILAAESKAGKTTMVVSLLQSLVDGVNFMGRFPVMQITDPNRVGYINLEMSERQLQQWLDQRGIKNSDRYVAFNMRGLGRKFDVRFPRTRVNIVKALKAANITILIVDTLGALLDDYGVEENDNTAVGMVLAGFDALMVEAGIEELLIVHHFGHTAERARGASKLTGWPDVRWELLLDKDDVDKGGYSNHRFFKALGRDVWLPESRVDYDPTKHTLTIEKDAKGRAANRALRSDRDVAEQIIAVLVATPGATLKHIRDTTGGRADRVGKLLGDLSSAGVIRITDGPRGAKYHTLDAAWQAAGSKLPW